MRIRYVLLTAVLALAGCNQQQATTAVPEKQPVAPVRPVTDTYFGTQITDPYRWMENRAAPEVIAYLKEQGAYGRAVIDRIPGRDKLQERIASHTGGGTLVSGVHSAGGHVFLMKRTPTENTYKLYVRESVDGDDRLLVDPDKNAMPGQHFSIDYYVESPDGTKVAYGISPGGSENSVIHVIDVATGKEAVDVIDRAENGGVSWLPDQSGFFYNRMIALKSGEDDTHRYLNSRALLHKLGTSVDTDVPLIGTGVAGTPTVTPVDTPIIFVQPGSPYALALIFHGSEPAVEILIAPLAEAAKPGAHWQKVADSPEGVTAFGLHEDKLYLLTHKDAPRYRVIAVDATHPDFANAETIVPASERVVTDIQVAADSLYVRDLDGGISKLRRYDFGTGRLTEVALPAQGTITSPVTDPEKPGALFGLSSWVMPPQWYSVSYGQVWRVSIAPKWSEDLSDYTSEEVKVRARDGVMVPLSIVHRKDLKLDGKAPLWITGYGSYGIALEPSLASSRIALLEDGGVFAVCHVRGGGEFGEEWHQQGFMATKPNTYLDLIDCAEYLHQHGYGSPATTAIEGRSAGGITVGMAMVERPDLFRVVFSGVGDSNALRAEFETDGSANALEYGSVKTLNGFRALAAVDALSHVKDGTAYPAALFTTGLNDPRVAPWQPGKMQARVQVATSSGRPSLLLVDPDAGHGIGSTKAQRDREMADQLAFMYWQIGKPEYQPPH